MAYVPMPDGSSSEALVISPWPSALRRRFRLPLSGGAGSASGAGGLVSTTVMRQLLRELGVKRPQLADATRHRERADQEHAGNEATHVCPVRHATSGGCVTQARETAHQLQQEPTHDEYPGVDARWKDEKSNRYQGADATRWVQHQETT